MKLLLLGCKINNDYCNWQWQWQALFQYLLSRGRSNFVVVLFYLTNNRLYKAAYYSHTLNQEKIYLLSIRR